VLRREIFLAGLLVTSCSGNSDRNVAPDPAQQAANCLNQMLSGQKSPNTTVTYVTFDDEGLRSYVFHLFTGAYFRPKEGAPIPKTNMVVASRISEEFYNALLDNPPQRAQDYDILLQSFGARSYLQLADLVRRSALDFENDEMALVVRTRNSPNQSYLIRDGDWSYRIISDGPPTGSLKTAVKKLLTGIDHHSATCASYV
jgi:hypothetical protein